MNAIRGLINNNNLRIVAGGIILFCSILDLSFGAAYVSAGSYLSLLPMSSLYSSSQGVKSVAGFTIFSSICMALATGFVFWDLSKNQANRTLGFIAWLLSIVIVLFNFTNGILTAQVYTPTAVFLRRSNASISDIGGMMGNTLNFAAAVTVFSFMGGFPASLYLLAVANLHREKIVKHNGEDETLSNSQAGEPGDMQQAQPQMQESQVEQVAQNESYNYNYQAQGLPQPLPTHSPFHLGMTDSTTLREPETIAQQELEMQKAGTLNNPAQREIEISPSSYSSYK